MLVHGSRKKLLPNSTETPVHGSSQPVLGRKQSLSVDQAIASVGDFGLAQKFQILLCVLTYAIAGLVTVLVVYSSSYVGDFDHIIRCIGDDTKGCEDAVKHRNHRRGDICGIHRTQWEYKHYTTLVSEFDLLCGKEWVCLPLRSRI